MGRDKGLKVGRLVLDILIGFKGNCKSVFGIIMYVSKFLMEIWFEVEFENYEYVILVISF